MRRAPLLLSFLLLLPACATGGKDIPSSYSAQPIRGKVVDASTGQPLEGVIIVAQWILYETSPGGENARKRLQVLETVTTTDGTYAFPAWGPNPNPTVIDMAHFYVCCFLTNRDPQLSFFKPGYRKLTVQNKGPSSDSPVRISQWDGKTIELQPFKGSLNEWATQLHFLQGDLSWGSQLEWRTCPRMILAIDSERVRLPGRTDWSVSDLEVLGTSQEELLRELGKRP